LVKSPEFWCGVVDTVLSGTRISPRFPWAFNGYPSGKPLLRFFTFNRIPIAEVYLSNRARYTVVKFLLDDTGGISRNPRLAGFVPFSFWYGRKLSSRRL